MKKSEEEDDENVMLIRHVQRKTARSTVTFQDTNSKVLKVLDPVLKPHPHHCLLYNLQPLLAATNSSSDAPSHSKVSPTQLLPNYFPTTSQPQDNSHSASSNLPRPSFKPNPTVRHSGIYKRLITVLI